MAEKGTQSAGIMPLRVNFQQFFFVWRVHELPKEASMPVHIIFIFRLLYVAAHICTQIGIKNS